MAGSSKKRDKVLKRLLKTPPKPHVPAKDKPLDRTAKEISQNGGSRADERD